MPDRSLPPTEVDFLLIGGGIAAVTAAQTLRDEGAQGSVLMLCAESVFPYNRPALTKGILSGEIVPDQIALLSPDDYRRNEIAVRLNSAAAALQPGQRRVVDQNGRTYQYKKLLIASGARPAKLDVPGARLNGIFQCRSLADVLALRKWVAGRGRAAILGTSFIAMEIATAFIRMGFTVTLIDQTDAVFPKIHSPTLSSYFLARCKAYGIDVLLGETVREFRGSDRLAELETTSGRVIQCDTAVLAVGAVPETTFLEGTGLQIRNGVEVDDFLQTSVADVFAAGDVACYPDRLGARQRVEHWDNARKQGRVAAKNMLGQRVPYDDIPHYFCDFLDFSFTFLGSSDDADLRIGRGNLDAKEFAEFYIRSDRIIGLFSTGRPPQETQTAETLIRDRVNVGAAAAQLANPAVNIGYLARETILILQGGGALGAFECGVVRAMAEAGIFPNIVGGVSVGAVNGAIIAANSRDPADALDAFWREISIHVAAMSPSCVASAFAVGSAMTWGIPGLFRPRWLAPPIGGEWWPPQWTSLCEAGPMLDLLRRYVDFSRLKSSPVRLIVGAVDVELGELAFFDSRVDQLTPEHILASASLPPMFPWTKIGERHYWDGGIVSNSPLEHVLKKCGADNKEIIVVDLFPGKRPLPSNLADVLGRRDEIIYGERIRNDAEIHELVHDFQALVEEILAAIDPDTAARLRQRPRYVHLMGLGGATSITRIVRDEDGREPPAATYDFSMQTIERHKRQGYAAAQKLVRHQRR